MPWASCASTGNFPREGEKTHRPRIRKEPTQPLRVKFPDLACQNKNEKCVIFTAFGDRYGLLLVMKRGRATSFDASVKKAVAVFRTEVGVRGDWRTNYRVPKFPYRFSVEANSRKKPN
jgi:hypothetical protein